MWRHSSFVCCMCFEHLGPPRGKLMSKPLRRKSQRVKGYRFVHDVAKHCLKSQKANLWMATTTAKLYNNNFLYKLYKSPGFSVHISIQGYRAQKVCSEENSAGHDRVNIPIFWWSVLPSNTRCIIKAIKAQLFSEPAQSGISLVPWDLNLDWKQHMKAHKDTWNEQLLWGAVHPAV